VTHEAPIKQPLRMGGCAGGPGWKPAVPRGKGVERRRRGQDSLREAHWHRCASLSTSLKSRPVDGVTHPRH